LANFFRRSVLEGTGVVGEGGTGLTRQLYEIVVDVRVVL
jgi:hypothetical protein